MAAFTIPNALGYAPNDPVTSVQMNLVNTQLPKAPNWVDGGATYNPTDQLVMGGAGMRWTGPSEFGATSTTTFENASTTVWESGSAATWEGTATFADGSLVTVEVDSTVELYGGITVHTGGGIIDFNSGAELHFDSGSTITGTASVANGATVALATGAALTAASGATATFGTGSAVVLGGTTTVTVAQPTSSQDPGADNRLVGTNLVKAWAAVRFNAGSATVLDGYNVASVSISLGTVGVVTMARAMANANYAITYGCGGAQHDRKYATTQGSGKTTTAFQFNVWDELAGSQVDLSDLGTDVIVSFCVMGRQ